MKITRSIAASLYLLAVLCISFRSAHAQSPTMINWTVNDGLAGDNVYYVFEDSQGFLWFSTETGVSRFDGQVFETFTTADGLADNEIFKIHEDSRGRIWFLGFGGELSYYHNGQWANPSNNAQLAALPCDHYFYGFEEFPDGSIWTACFNRGIYRIYPDGTVRKPQKFTIPDEILCYPFSVRAYFIEALDNGEVLAISFSGLGKVEQDGSFREMHHFNHSGHHWIAHLGKDTIMDFVKAKWGYFDLKNETYTLGPKLDFMPGDVIFSDHDREGRLWLGTYQGAVRFKGRTPDPEGATVFLPGLHVSSVLQDREGGFWFTTQNKGIFYAPSLDVTTLTIEDGLPDAFFSCLAIDDQDRLWMGFERGLVAQFRHGKLQKRQLIQGTHRRRIYGILPLPNDETWLYSDGVVIRIHGDDTLKLKDNCRAIEVDANGRLFIGRTYFVSYYDTIPEQAHFGIEEGTRVTNLAAFDMHADKKGGVYVATLKGLFYFDGKELRSLAHLHPALSRRIAGIDMDASGRAWVGTYDAGLVIIDGDSARHVPPGEDGMEGLRSAIVRGLDVDDRNEGWLATNKGLEHIGFRPNGDIVVSHMTVSEGLASNDVTDVVVHNDTVYAATAKGLAIFDRRTIEKEDTPPLIRLRKFRTGSRDLPTDTLTRLRWRDNRVQIEYVGIASASKGAIQYRYRLLGLDSAWQYTRSSVVEFNALPARNYTFEVSAANGHGTWSEQPVQLAFTILPPFWQQWWFRVAAAVLIAALLFWGVGSTLHRTRKREQRKTEINRMIAESELKALQAQMNPHFIFNALNSIQDFVFSNEQEAAYHYLERFGSLIRRILENSRRKLISLEEEIATMEIYLELESLRFEGRFSYNITTDPEIETSTVRIPPMVVQPYVENAIWHGLMPKMERGHVDVEFSRKKKSLLIAVEDNGIGREASRERRSKHKRGNVSRGMQTTSERMRYLNMEHEDQYLVHIIDLKDEAGNAIGTRVELQMPYLN